MKKKRADERGTLLRKKEMQKGLEWINIHSARICVQYILLRVVLHDALIII